MVSEEGEPEEVAEVLGRACGDRVAVVQCYPGVRDIELFGTIAHELLHTMGFDHTTHWRCLMNPSCYDDEWLFLAPHNLKKLKLFLSQESNSSFVLDRYKRLLSIWWEVFEDASCDDVKKHYAWLEEKVAFLESTDRQLADNELETEEELRKLAEKPLADATAVTTAGRALEKFKGEPAMIIVRSSCVSNFSFGAQLKESD